MHPKHVKRAKHGKVKKRGHRGGPRHIRHRVVAHTWSLGASSGALLSLHSNWPLPGISDDVEDGDDHLRLIKLVLKNTLGGLTGPMAATHGQLNYLQYINTTNVPVLATDISAFAVGPFSGIHLALGGGAIQAKSIAAATTLELNKLGGGVNIGPQAGTGVVSLYNSAQKALITQANGIGVRDHDGNLPAINLYNSADTALVQIIYSAGLYIQNLVNSSTIALQVKDSGGNIDNVLVGTPDGSVGLYYSGVLDFLLSNIGVQIFSPTGTTPTIELFRNDLTTRNAYIQAATTGLSIVQEVPGQPIYLTAKNISGVLKVLFQGDPDDNTYLFAAGSLALQLNSIGGYLFSTANDNPELQFYRSDKNTRNAFLIAATTGLSLVNEVHGTPMQFIGEDNGGTQRVLIAADPDTGVAINYYDQAALATAFYLSNGTGATLRAPDGSMKAAGLHGTSILNTGVALALRIANSGSIIRATAAVDITLDTTTDLAENGFHWGVENAAGVNITITPTGVSLLWLDGSAGLAGARTLAPYGWIDIFKVSNGNYRIGGVGLS